MVVQQLFNIMNADSLIDRIYQGPPPPPPAKYNDVSAVSSLLNGQISGLVVILCVVDFACWFVGLISNDVSSVIYINVRIEYLHNYLLFILVLISLISSNIVLAILIT